MGRSPTDKGRCAPAEQATISNKTPLSASSLPTVDWRAALGISHDGGDRERTRRQLWSSPSRSEAAAACNWVPPRSQQGDQNSFYLQI